MLLLVAPIKIAASEVRNSYEDYQKTVIDKPDCDPVKAVGQSSEDCFYKESKKVFVASDTSEHKCNCVLWAQANGLNITGYGAAENYPINSSVPSSSGFVITYEGTLGHMAKYILSGEYLILTEANFVSCQITTGRLLPITSKLIKGYIN